MFPVHEQTKAGNLSGNTLEVLRERYLRKNDAGKVIESPDGLFCRVARSVASAERLYGCGSRSAQAEETFYRLMRGLEFLPNSPTLMNAGTDVGQLSACFVVPVEDSIDSIFNALKSMAKIHQTGGGTGFSFTHLRQKDDLVSSTKGRASGPVSFMKIFDAATGVIVQGGRRRGANMGILSCTHPDIIEFIEAKERGGFENFNLSVSVTDEFMRKAALNERYALVSPRTGKNTRTVRAGDVFHRIAEAAWRTGDPGLIFEDEINRRNPTPALGRIEATNPCGELPLLPYESCTLGSVNLARMVSGGKIDWERLRACVAWGIRFLDDVIDVNVYPLPEIRDMTLANRKIGLGVMGFADMLILLGIPYDSTQAVACAGRVMSFIHEESVRTSAALAAERGVFPNFTRSVHVRSSGHRMRNATVNTVAPTGTISLIAGCSSGIEPLFALSFVRHVMKGKKLIEYNALFEQYAKARGFYSGNLMSAAARRGTVRGLRGVPPDTQRIFASARDIDPRWHVRIQAAFQAHTDNSVSKTVNLPADATVSDIKKIYFFAHRLKCKGITVYRYGSKTDQVLTIGGAVPGPRMRVHAEYSGGCPEKLCVF